MTTITFTRQDNSGENTSTVFNVPYALDDTWYASVSAAYVDLRAAVDAISAAPTHRATVNVVLHRATPQRGGHRELKWVLRFKDGEGRTYVHEVGTANLSLPRVYAGGKALLSPSWTGYNNMKTRLEEHVVNPYGQPLTLIEVEEVGRNI